MKERNMGHKQLKTEIRKQRKKEGIKGQLLVDRECKYFSMPCLSHAYPELDILKSNSRLHKKPVQIRGKDTWHMVNSSQLPAD